MAQFGITKKLAAGYEEALRRIPEALKEEGFGVLTEIDVRETLKRSSAWTSVPTREVGELEHVRVSNAIRVTATESVIRGRCCRADGRAPRCFARWR